MRASKAFVLGAIMGAAVWLWGRDIEEYVEDKTRGVRTKAADLSTGLTFTGRADAHLTDRYSTLTGRRREHSKLRQ